MGFDARLVPGNVTLLADAPAAAPPIVFFETAPLDYWQIDCAHVAVLVGVGDDTVFLNDSCFDAAPQRTSLASFRQAWAATGQFAALIVPRS